MPSLNNLAALIKSEKSVLIASDIDRTLLMPPLHFTKDEIEVLATLHRRGVTFLFATGRTEVAARGLITPLPFSSYLAPQNGASLLSFPAGVICKQYSIPLEELSPELKKGWLFIGEKASYYEPDGFSEDEQVYLIERAHRLKETCLDEHPRFPIFSLKRFGFREELEKKAAPFRDLGYSVTLTRDIVEPSMTVAQITPKGVNKGKALEDLIDFLEIKPSFIIGCGDDFNDIPLLEKSDFKIVMEDAPDAVKKLADHIAEDAEKGGLFKVLKNLFIL